MHEILPSLRTLLVDHLATEKALVADMPPGSSTVNVSNTSRFRPGDEVFLMSSAGVAEKARVFSVDDFETITLFEPTVPGWAMADGSILKKAIAHFPLKRVFIGDLRRIPDFPTITISQASESNEWWALGATEHEFRLSIRVYVQTSDFEGSEILLSKYARAVREVLIDHIHPIVNGETEFFPMTLDMPVGSTVVSVADTSSFEPDRVVILRDATLHSTEENMVRTILSPTTMELWGPTTYGYLVSREAEVLKLNRYLYDTRPSETSYGFVPGAGGSLLRAAEISWYGKEIVCRRNDLAT